MRTRSLALTLVLAGPPALASEVEIVLAELEERDGAWDVAVTLRHPDRGWEHYADAWRVVDAEGKVLATRTLLHPHEDEQPFTRSLSGVSIPPTSRMVYVEAHDKVHGWTRRRLAVDLGRSSGPGYRVRRSS